MMKKNDAVKKAKISHTAGELRAILKAATFEHSKPSVLNGAFSKVAVWNSLHNAIADDTDETIVDEGITFNILREFAPDEAKPVGVILT